MNARDLISNVCQQTGMPVPSGVVASKDKTIAQMMALLGQLGAELITAHPWQRLVREKIIRTQAFTVTGNTTKGMFTVSIPDTSSLNPRWIAQGDGIPAFAVVEQVTSPSTIRLNQPASKTGTTSITFHQYAYDLPDDWQRQVPATEYNRSDIRPVYGPQTSHAWQKARSSVVFSGQDLFRIANGQLQLLYPVPEGITLAYEYISKNWVINSGGSKGQITRDDDEFIFSDALLMTGLKARWFDAHGMDSTIEKADFAGLLNMEKAQNSGAKTLSISPSRAFPSPTVPDGSWTW